MRRHTVETRNLVDLEFPRFKKLHLLGWYGNLLIFYTFLENDDPARVHRAAVDGMPALTELRRVF